MLFRAVNDLDSVFGGQRSARLGWEAYPYDFIESVVDVGGDHFTLFDEENVGRWPPPVGPISCGKELTQGAFNRYTRCRINCVRLAMGSSVGSMLSGARTAGVWMGDLSLDHDRRLRDSSTG